MILNLGQREHAVIYIIYNKYEKSMIYSFYVTKHGKISTQNNRKKRGGFALLDFG